MDTFPEAKARAAARIAVRAAAGLPSRPVDVDLIAEPHEHAEDRCCGPHGHHVDPHRGCILR